LRAALLGLAMLVTSPPARAALAYVTNQGDDSVSVVDTTTGTVVQTVGVGAKPAGVAVAADGQHVYVTNPEGRSVSILERQDGRLSAVAEVPAGAGPLGIAVSPTDGRVFVADWYGDTVAVLDAAGSSLGR